MTREEELKALYTEAMALTQSQSVAIAGDDWDEFIRLLNDREHCLARAEELLAAPDQPANRVELRSQLAEIHQLDLANQETFRTKQAALKEEMQGLGRTRSALSGYLESYGDVIDANFFDQDQ